MTLELGQPTDRKPPFKYSALARVSFSDTDAQGVVYYGRYMPFFDLSRIEYLRHLGLVAGDTMIALAMRAMTVEYLAPARFDDTVEIFVRVSRVGTTSVTFDHAAYRVGDDLLLATARQTNVHLDIAERRPLPLPDEHRTAIAAFEESDLEQ